MTASEWLDGLVVALIIVFNTGMAARITKTVFDGLGNPDGLNRKRIGNQVKAVVIIDSISGLVVFISSYFKG